MEEALTYVDKNHMEPPLLSDDAMLEMLEERLRRIEFVVNGGDGTLQTQQTGGTANVNANTRLQNLERGLQALSRRSRTVSDVLQLQQQYPELFHPAEPGLVSDNSRHGSMLPPDDLAHLILAHAHLYTSSSSRLTALQDASQILNLDPAPLAKLVEVQERGKTLQVKHDAQAQEVAELRARSCRVVETWYESGVLGMGGNWAEWEGRLKESEILVRRREAVKRRDENLA